MGDAKRFPAIERARSRFEARTSSNSLEGKTLRRNVTSRTNGNSNVKLCAEEIENNLEADIKEAVFKGVQVAIKQSEKKKDTRRSSRISRKHALAETNKRKKSVRKQIAAKGGEDKIPSSRLNKKNQNQDYKRISAGLGNAVEKHVISFLSKENIDCDNKEDAEIEETKNIKLEQVIESSDCSYDLEEFFQGSDWIQEGISISLREKVESLMCTESGLKELEHITKKISQISES